MAIFLRVWKLGSYPASLSWDEVAIGYNAYSIAQTGKDEYAHKFPILFKSFNDFKLPGYIYLDSLFIRIFGLSEFTVRFPSAFLGIMAVILIYFLTKELIKGQDYQIKIWKVTVDIALLTMLFLAISPWHLQFSRGAFEANGALTFVLTGILFLIIGFKKPLFAFLSTPFLAFSLYFYYSPRVFLPVFLAIFAFLYKKKLFKNLKFYVFGLLFALLISLPIVKSSLTQEGLKRVKEVSIFKDQSLTIDYTRARASQPGIFATFFLNRKVPVIFESLHGYFSHFSPGFLFFGDDPNPRHRSAFHGNLYLFEIPLLLVGFWVLIGQKEKKTKYLVLAWLLLAPIPAAFTKETPHALRSLLMLPPLIILSSLGAIDSIKRYSWTLLPISIAVVLFFVNYLYSYYLVYPIRNSLSWAYGYKQMFQKTSEIEKDFDSIIVTGHYWKPYVFYLFYNKIEPVFYHLPQNWQESIGKYKFGRAIWDRGEDLNGKKIDKLKGNRSLVVISPQEFDNLKNQERFLLLSEIKDFSNDRNIFLIGQWN